MNIKKLTVLAGWILLFSAGAFGKNYYCDPVNGSMANDGSKETPWSTLQAVFEAHKSFAAGDTIFLIRGDHGKPYLFGRNSDYVVITPYATDTAVVESIRFSSASFWKVDGLHITSELPEGDDVYDMIFLVQTSSNSDHILFENCEVYSYADTKNWTRDDWFTRTSSGFMMKSSESGLLNNHILNINFAIVVEGQHTSVIGNTIENFVGDGIRGLASYCRYEYNVVKNCYDVTGYNASEEGPGNHDDGFQSYTSAVGGVEETVKEVILRNNIFISYTDPAQIEKSMMQGVGCFDGYFYKWTIENNLVVTDSWHGISFLGIEDSKIANNTVLSNPISNDLEVNGTPVDDMTPWIWIGPLKDDRGDGPSNDNIIRNNLIIQSKAGFNGNKAIYDQGVNTLVQNNTILPTGQEGSFFTGPQNLDFHLKAGSPAIDQGINIDLWNTDLDGHPRLAGTAVDAGAYEFDDGSFTEHAPVLDRIPDTLTKETDTLVLTITATDQDDDVLTFSLSPAVPFISFEDLGDGTAVLTARPEPGQYGTYKLTVTVSDGTHENIRNFVLTVEENPLSVSKISLAGQLTLYPNPVKENFFYLRKSQDLSFSPENILITDMSGKTVYSLEVPREWGSTLRIDLPHGLANGVYLLRISSGRGAVSLPFLLEH